MEQNKDNTIVGKLKRLLRPIYQMQRCKLKMEIHIDDNKVHYLDIEKAYKYKHFLIAMDTYIDKKYVSDLSVSVEGHDTWKETVDIFLSIIKDQNEL